MTAPFKKSRFADRGKKAEAAVKSFLDVWAYTNSQREFSRLIDTKAAGRTIKAAAADFEFFAWSPGMVAFHGLIEVKETEHEYRLARDKVPQLARLRKRQKCGGHCFVLVLHSTLGLWRIQSAAELAETGDKGSWNLTNTPTFRTCAEALASALPEVFL